MERGSYRALSPARKVIMEILHHGQKVPSLPTGRRSNIAPLVAARRDLASPPTWMAIFTRAYGLAAVEHPELRSALISYPWPRLYVHPETVCTVLVEREWQGELVVLAAKIRGPENQSLEALSGHLKSFQERPVLEVSDFRQMLRLGRLPGFMRRFAFWSTLHLSGYKRAKRFGTCSISSLGRLGAEQYHPISPLTTYFSVGPVSDRGDVEFKIIYDHRIMDDSQVARCLRTVERILHDRLLPELDAAPRRAA